jgi:hypothetical protein
MNKMKFIIAILVLDVIISAAANPAFAVSEDYRKGYDLACLGRIVPGHQSDNFMSGYVACAIACHHNPNAIQQRIQAQQSLQ